MQHKLGTRRDEACAQLMMVLLDYLANEFIESKSLFMRYSRAVINATGEPWRFGIDNTPPVRERVETFLKSCGLIMEEQRNFGHETTHSRALAGFAVATVPDAPLGVR